MDRARLAHVYWIGGSPCAGKSSIAQMLAEQYHLHYYQCDALFAAHQQRARPEEQPALTRLATLSCDEIWLPSIPEQVARVQAIYTEEFAMVLEDLLALRPNCPILAEGAALMPALVLPHLSDRRQAIWITPTPAFQRMHYSRRPWIHDVLRTCSDPDQAFTNWMARDETFAQWVNEQTATLGLRLIQVNGQRALAEMTTIVAAWLQFM